MPKLIKFVPILSGKEYFQILINPIETTHLIFPGFELNGNETNVIAEIIQHVETILMLKVRTISPEPIHTDDNHSIYAGFISVYHSEELLHELNYQWVHSRFANRRLRTIGWISLIDDALNWASSHDFAIENLSNNMDKLS